MTRGPRQRPARPPRHLPPVNLPGAGRGVLDPREPPRPMLVAAATEVVAQLREAGVDPKYVITAGAARVVARNVQAGPPAAVFMPLCSDECIGIAGVTFLVRNAAGGPAGTVRPVWETEDQLFTDDSIAPIAVAAGASIRIPVPAHAMRVGLQGRADAVVGGVGAVFTIAVGFVR